METEGVFTPSKKDKLARSQQELSIPQGPLPGSLAYFHFGTEQGDQLKENPVSQHEKTGKDVYS